LKQKQNEEVLAPFPIAQSVETLGGRRSTQVMTIHSPQFDAPAPYTTALSKALKGVNSTREVTREENEEVLAPSPIAQPDETQGGRRSTPVRRQPKAYAPSLSGTKYSYAMTRLETTRKRHQRHQSQDGGFLFTQVEKEFEPQIEKEFEPQIEKLFKRTQGTKIKLDLKEIILLDSQSTIDLFCNLALIEKSFKSDAGKRLKSNGGTMMVTHKAKVAGYNTDVWYNKKAITNILALSNVRKQYRSPTTITTRCLWCIKRTRASQTWSSTSTKADYTTTIRAKRNLRLSTLSQESRKDPQRGRTRVQRPHRLCTPGSVTRPWKT
jgi:hypothetical protein